MIIIDIDKEFIKYETQFNNRTMPNINVMDCLRIIKGKSKLVRALENNLNELIEKY